MNTILDALGVENIVVYFQPIVSLQRFKIIGLEALCRGINKGEIVPPNYLFSLAREINLSLEFDRLCRKLALDEFNKLRQKYNNMMLFLNHDLSLIDEENIEYGYTYDYVKKTGISSGSIVVEICESKVIDVNKLEQFVHDYKEYGFLVALDDVGNSHSNLNRIPELKPDILKIDRNLIRDVDKSWHKKKILKSISYLAKDIRSLVIAEGVETKEEIMDNLEMGIEFFQGFYFARPVPPGELKFEPVETTAREIALLFRDQMVTKFKKRRKYFQYIKEALMYIASRLRRLTEEKFNNALKYLAHNYPEIECVYILNEYGVQITDTIFVNDVQLKAKNHLFLPVQKGDDLSTKDYFYSLMYCNSMYYVTDPYLSRATGNKCITISTLFESHGKKYILCVDVRIDKINNSTF